MNLIATDLARLVLVDGEVREVINLHAVCEVAYVLKASWHGPQSFGSGHQASYQTQRRERDHCNQRAPDRHGFRSPISKPSLYTNFRPN